MAQSKVLPNSTVLTVAAAGGTATEKLIVCLTQTGYTIANATVDASSFCGTDTLPGTQTFDLPFSGQRVINPDSGNISEKGLFDLIQQKTRIEWTLGKQTPTTGDIIYTGEGYLNNFATDNGINTVPTMTGTINADSDTVVAVETP